ncbi:hypothetical protein [Pedobacter frigidisoli]|uniref:hypothetical protein n=1 Tax=Pedobacter frigidisoli TaxID=2530455 RepID=UPI00292E7A7F|nr:hypothetical protein [Pedobacter frigidisoli]
MIRKQFDMPSTVKNELIQKLLANRISRDELGVLRAEIDEIDLANIIQQIYDLNIEQVRKLAALAPVMNWVDKLKNSRRNHLFVKKVKANFRKHIAKKNGLKNRVIVVEGDSWFNYPVLLSDVIDWISMEENMAVYSVASGGDWLLNMISAKKYVEHLSTLQPDVFIISGGGNDLVGNNRIAAMVTHLANSDEFEHSEFAQYLFKSASRPLNGQQLADFKDGVKFISKDFYALLGFFQLQYYFLINGILNSGKNEPATSKFPGIQIITQGYDYAIPNDQRWVGLNPFKWYRTFARTFLGHGSWLKTPLQLRGIYDSGDQRKIVFAMIFLFNEMMIDIGRIFKVRLGENRVFHIDSRDSVGENGWTDELHPLPAHFKETAQAFIQCINNPDKTGDAVIRVTDLNKENNP